MTEEEEEVTIDKDGKEIRKKELVINIKHLKNKVHEIRMKINMIMAGDYGIDEDDVALAVKLNELNIKKIDFD